MTSAERMFPRTMALLNEAILDAVAEILVGASDEEIKLIAEAKNLDFDQLAEHVRAKVAKAGEQP